MIALGVFLANQGYLGPGDLDENTRQRHLPLAFQEFIAGDDALVEQAFDHLGMYEGSYSHIEDAGPLSEGEYRHHRLDLSYEGGAVTARMSDSHLNKIDTMRRLKRDASVRKRALRHELMHSGFALGMPNGRLVIFLKPAAYDEVYSSHVYLIWATRKPAQEGDGLTSVMVMNYPESGEVEDLEAAYDHLTGIERKGVFVGLPTPHFQIFDRD